MPLKTVNPTTLNDWIKNDQAVIVDVREQAEYASENIEKASLVPLGKICKDALPNCRDKKLVIHCSKGGRGESACQKLLTEDPELEIYNLEGGIEAWKSIGLPVETSGKKILPLDRQVQLAIGISVLLFSLLAYFVQPVFAFGAAFFGAGLVNAGLTGWCGLALFMAKMPWNR